MRAKAPSSRVRSVPHELTKRRSPRAGFTLLELSLVMGLLGLLAGIGVTTYSTYKRQALTSEAVGNVHAIHSLQLGHPGGPVTCPASPTTVPRGQQAVWEQNEGFRQLGYSPGRLTRYQYEVLVEETDGSTRFVVRARGDLDGDGNTSLFERSSSQAELHIEDGTE